MQRARSGSAVFILLLACSRASTAPPSTVQPEPAASPSATPRLLLRVGTSGDYAPFSKRAGDAAPVGFDVDVAGALARDLGFEVRFVPFRWPELGARLGEGAFDVAMSGVTWQPTRAVTGYMTRAVAHGGPCLLGDAQARDIGVNHGGVLESWAKKRFPDRNLVIVDDNLGLPALLAAGRVQAIVTDSFERRSFEHPGLTAQCEAAVAQKVYWISAARATELGPAIDGWLANNVPRIKDAQARWFGEQQRLDTVTHLVDLLARRLAFMPLVAALKAAKNLPIDDPPREVEVLEGVRRSAERLHLPELPTLELFRLQIELSKAVQRRQSEPSALGLKEQIRPALTELGERILQALVEARAAGALSRISDADLEGVTPWLLADERRQLEAALRELGH